MTKVFTQLFFCSCSILTKDKGRNVDRLVNQVLFALNIISQQKNEVEHTFLQKKSPNLTFYFQFYPTTTPEKDI